MSASSSSSSTASELLTAMIEETTAAGTRVFSAFDVKRNASRIVDSIPLERQFVLLGESTHGTEEFYLTRAEVTKRLVEDRGFKAVVFEADWPMMQRINDYTHRRRQTPFQEPVSYPSWMWQNECMQQFYNWCRNRPASAAVELFGMDCYSLFESKKIVVSFLQQHDPEFADEVTSRLAYMDKFQSGFEYADAMVNGNLKLIAPHIQDCLTKIQSRLQWGSDKYAAASPLERLDAEQNCEVLIAADEYYRKCVSEPPGSRASWNARDQHMTTTLLRIQQHMNHPKVVVWAHNSHIGDAMGTEKGGNVFERNEQWNLGQMVRATFGVDRTWIVGQYTFSGTVVASKRWGGPHEAFTLLPALDGSFEATLHRIATTSGYLRPPECSFTFTTAAFADPLGGLAQSMGSAAAEYQEAAQLVQRAIAARNPIAVALHKDLFGKGPQGKRLQRWVGVNYLPETERASHYGEVALAVCYDQIVFVDETRGLEPIKTIKRSFDDVDSGVLSTVTVRRLQKEYQRMQSTPPDFIRAHPLLHDILEWHFAIEVSTSSPSPYAGGVYHGVLNFPPEYPQQPPSIRMLTPSGRFEVNVRLCLSMSDYHPESWNPTWSVETIIVGLQSFMLEESNAIGSLKATDGERRQLAQSSHAFNVKNAIFQEFFGANSTKDERRRGVSGTDAATATQESVCRYCMCSGGHLIAPCMCKGSTEWVHLECLRAWQKSVLLTQPTHPKYQTSIDRICNVCLEPFSGEGIPPSRHEQILLYTGNEIASLIKPGNLLVSSRDKSREYMELMKAHPEVQKSLAPWTKAVFLILTCNSEHMMAVSMSVPMSQPFIRDAKRAGLPGDGTWQWQPRRTSATSSPRVVFKHWDGGPCGKDDPQFVLSVDHAEELLHRLPTTKLRFAPPHWLATFNFSDVEAVISEASLRRTPTTDPACPLVVNVVWGFGGWGATQVLAEIARGGWGIVTMDAYINARPDPSLDWDWMLDMEWSRMMPLAKCAPPSEYSKARER